MSPTEGDVAQGAAHPLPHRLIALRAGRVGHSRPGSNGTTICGECLQVAAHGIHNAVRKMDQAGAAHGEVAAADGRNPNAPQRNLPDPGEHPLRRHCASNCGGLGSQGLGPAERNAPNAAGQVAQGPEPQLDIHVLDERVSVSAP